jgi:hypothetical protein
LSDIVSEIKCRNCGAPLTINPGEIVSTCRYCGYTAVVGADEPFQLEHSLILNNNNAASIENALRDWMREGFMKPGDLAKKSKILTLELRYLPFWLVPMDATSLYEGVLERVSPPSPRKGVIDRDYDWLVLGRKGAQFPTRDYTVPDTGKIPFDFKRIDSGAKFLNSEMTSEEAVQHARDEVEANQRFLAKQEVDQITSFNTNFKVDKPTYIHAPIWFSTYEYKGRSYNALLDGSSGTVLRADIPQTDFKMI